MIGKKLGNEVTILQQKQYIGQNTKENVQPNDIYIYIYQLYMPLHASAFCYSKHQKSCRLSKVWDVDQLPSTSATVVLSESVTPGPLPIGSQRTWKEPFPMDIKLQKCPKMNKVILKIIKQTCENELVKMNIWKQCMSTQLEIAFSKRIQPSNADQLVLHVDLQEWFLQIQLSRRYTFWSLFKRSETRKCWKCTVYSTQIGQKSTVSDQVCSVFDHLKFPPGETPHLMAQLHPLLHDAAVGHRSRRGNEGVHRRALVPSQVVLRNGMQIVTWTGKEVVLLLFFGDVAMLKLCQKFMFCTCLMVRWVQAKFRPEIQGMLTHQVSNPGAPNWYVEQPPWTSIAIMSDKDFLKHIPNSFTISIHEKHILFFLQIIIIYENILYIIYIIKY